MDRGAALDLAARIGASFPSSRVTGATLDEWAGELQRLQPERGERLLEWLRNNVDRAPSFKQLRAGMAVTSQPKPSADTGYGRLGDSPCVFCGNEVKNDLDAAMRYDADLDQWRNAHVSCANQQPGTTP